MTFFIVIFTKIGRILKNRNVNMFCEFQIFSLYGTCPFSPVRAIFLAEFCNPVTRQAIELESCSNPLRIPQVLLSKWKKTFFRFGFERFWGERHKKGCFCVILAIYAWPWAPCQWNIFGLKV